MSGSLLEIKKKTHGIKNTRKITKAMQLVAASKMRQFQKKAIHARDFVKELLKALYENINNDHQSIYTEEREKGKTLFVLYTSDKGLCGSLNNRLINGLFRSEKWKNLKEEERMLITIGKKSQSFAISNKIPVTKHFSGISEQIGAMDAMKVVNTILELWVEEADNDNENEQVKEVVFMSPHYKNSFTFYPTMKTFLPFSKTSIKNVIGDLDGKYIDGIFAGDEDQKEPEDDYAENNNMLYEPDQELILERLYEQILQALFVSSFLELKASEYSSRMIAMQNATEAADKIIGALTLAYNKARQQAITQEIAELIGASMAISEQD